MRECHSALEIQLCTASDVLLTPPYICTLGTVRIMGIFFHARKPETLGKWGPIGILSEAPGSLQETPLIFSTGKKQHSLHWAVLQLCTWLIFPGCHLSICVEGHTSSVTQSPELHWLTLGSHSPLPSLLPAVCTQPPSPNSPFGHGKINENFLPPSKSKYLICELPGSF